MDRREQNIRVFFDTETWCRSTEKLRRSVRKSKAGTGIVSPEEKLHLPDARKDQDIVIHVTDERTFQAAMRLHREHPGSRIGVLNFASATHPGGGVRSGSSAQEESLCRCSTLYPVLADPSLSEGFYTMHRNQNDVRYTDACIYSPDIVICKTDTAVPERMPEEEWVKVDVITCAAPNLRPRQDSKPDPSLLSEEALMQLHISRAGRILDLAASRGLDILVSGAFGCGVFMNDPRMVSAAWKQALEERKGLLQEVVFAVYTTRRDPENYEVFREAFCQANVHNFVMAGGSDGYLSDRRERKRKI